MNDCMVDNNIAADCITSPGILFIVWFVSSAKMCVHTGSSHKAVKECFKEHKGYLNQHTNLLRKGKIKVYHFNLSDHSKSDMRITLVGKVQSKDLFMREERRRKINFTPTKLRESTKGSTESIGERKEPLLIANKKKYFFLGDFILVSN